MSREDKRTPISHPIENLAIFSEHIDGMLDADKEQYASLLEARPRPYLLDDHTINRVFAIYTTQQNDLYLFDDQLARWKAQENSHTPAQNKEVARLRSHKELSSGFEFSRQR